MRRDGMSRAAKGLRRVIGVDERTLRKFLSQGRPSRQTACPRRSFNRMPDATTNVPLLEHDDSSSEDPASGETASSWLNEDRDA